MSSQSPLVSSMSSVSFSSACSSDSSAATSVESSLCDPHEQQQLQQQHEQRLWVDEEVQPEQVARVRGLRSWRAPASSSVAVVGMSLQNGFFTFDRVRDLLVLLSRRFGKVVVWVPTYPARHTFKALGYSNQKVKTKIKKDGNNMVNKVRRAIDFCVEQIGIPAQRFVRIDWLQDVETCPEYTKTLQSVTATYHNNDDFAGSVRATTAQVTGRIGKKGCIDIEVGVHTLLEELAFLTVCPLIVDAAADQSLAVVYHKPWPIFEAFVAGEFHPDVEELPNMGFLLVRDGSQAHQQQAAASQ